MNSNQEIEAEENAAEDAETENSISVDDFIRELEAKEKDLHITAEMTVIEIENDFDDGELPEFIKSEFPEELPAAAKPKPAHKTKTEQSKLEAENKKLKEKIAKYELEHEESTKDAQRRKQDFSNFKTRTERERRESFQNQVSNLATKMLPVLDNLNRAVDFAIEHERAKSEEFRPFFDGVFLVNQQLNEVLAEMGIEPILTIGEDFDPYFHEAAATEETVEFPPNTICGEMLKGYRIGDRVVRHSIVKVAKPFPKAIETSVLEKMFNHESGESAAEIENEPDHDERQEESSENDAGE
ncbi:MAG: nucleotide exchange factor GrpE [Pyrinomonadaceae bacterium]